MRRGRLWGFVHYCDILSVSYVVAHLTFRPEKICGPKYFLPYGERKDRLRRNKEHLKSLNLKYVNYNNGIAATNDLLPLPLRLLTIRSTFLQHFHSWGRLGPNSWKWYFTNDPWKLSFRLEAYQQHRPRLPNSAKRMSVTPDKKLLREASQKVQ